MTFFVHVTYKQLWLKPTLPNLVCHAQYARAAKHGIHTQSYSSSLLSTHNILILHFNLLGSMFLLASVRYGVSSAL
jgi:hypothetical protein